MRGIARLVCSNFPCSHGQGHGKDRSRHVGYGIGDAGESALNDLGESISNLTRVMTIISKRTRSWIFESFQVRYHITSGKHVATVYQLVPQLFAAVPECVVIRLTHSTSFQFAQVA